MASWPATLPQAFEQDGYSEPFASNVVRTEMDVGPPKVRKRYTAAVKQFAGLMYLTETQAETLETFYETTTNWGSDAFDWVHPRTGAAISCRFAGPPVLEQARGRYVAAMIQIEVLP